MSLLEQIRSLLAENLSQRAAAQTDLEAILEAVSSESRNDLTSDEQEAFDGQLAAIRTLDTDRAALDARVSELEEIESRATAAKEAALSIPQMPVANVTREELTYSKRSENSFLSDVFAAKYGSDFDAQQRLARHSNEMRSAYGAETRDVGSSAFAGLVVPQYLTDEYAALSRAGRPFADRVRKATLPASGMTVNISRITTGSAVAAQATENASVQETNMDDTLLTVNVNTIAGMQDVSRQAIDRGTGVDSVVIGDLIGAYHAELDRQCINGSGSSGEHLGVLGVSGINAVTYTDASPTVAESYAKIADAIQQVNAARFLPADVIVMAPRRWGWFTAALDSSNRPLVVPTAALNPVAIGEAAAYNSVGMLQGLPVVTDGNVPTNLGAGTNEDRIIATRASDAVLWEEAGAPLRLRLDEVLGHQLSVRFVVYGYSAFTAGRYPASSSVISGTGLVTPTF